MRLELINTYPAVPADVLAMATDQAFRESACRAQEALDFSVEVSGSGPGATVVVTQRQELRDAPSVATKLVGDSVVIARRETWRTPVAADLNLEIPGKPVRLRGSITLLDKGDGTTEQIFAGDLTVSVPLVGGKLERLIGDVLTSALRREGRAGLEWLARRDRGATG